MPPPTGTYRANAASPQPTQQLSDISAGPLYAAETHQPGRLRHLANASVSAISSSRKTTLAGEVDFYHGVSN